MNIPCLSQPQPPEHLRWKLFQKVTSCQCKMTMSFEVSKHSQSTPRFRKYYAIIQLRKEIQPRKVRNRTGNKSWFSLVHKFFFQLNLYRQPRAGSYEKHNKSYGFCYTPEPCFSSLNPNYLGSVWGSFTCNRGNSKHPESGYTFFAIWYQNGSLLQGKFSMDALKLLKSRT